MAVIVREKVKGSGEWWIFINHKGKRRSKKIGTKKAANAVAREVETRLASGDMGVVKDRCPTLSSYGQEWLKSPFHEWSDSTRKLYGTTFDLHIKPALGGRELDEIKRGDIKNLIARLKSEGLSSSRMRSVTGVLSGIYNNAIEDEVVEANPCQKTGKYTGNSRKNKIEPLAAEEVTELLENAFQGLSFELYVLFLLAVRSGLRIGEMLALEWSDIDFDERVVEITKSWNYHTKQMGPPKNGKPRKVDITPMTVEALRKLRAITKVVSLNGAIFTDESGERLQHLFILRALKRVASRPVRIHDLRHTYATLRVAKGDNIVDVSNQLGHHDPGFTLKAYAHWLPGKHKIQVDELDEVAPACTLTAP